MLKTSNYSKTNTFKQLEFLKSNTIKNHLINYRSK